MVSQALKMSRVYTGLLAIAALLISVTGASFSIAGLAKLFSGAAASVAFMAASLEFAKLVVTGFLYRYWGHIPRLMRGYLTAAVVILMAITSMGIYGYLSAAYQQSSMRMQTQQLQLAALEAENQRVQGQLGDLQKFTSSIPDKFISKKLQFRRQSDAEASALRGRSNEILTQIEGLKIELLNTQAKIGPIIYFAKAVGADPEHCVQWLIFLFVLVFDPLAVCLIFSLNLAIRLREKYRGNETRISAHAMTTPVDHRFKKTG